MVGARTLDVTEDCDRCLILVVDDQALVRYVTNTILEEAGFDVLLAEGGDQAIKILKKYKKVIAAVLLDYSMPEMDGIQTFYKIRSICPNLPVVMTSGYKEPDIASHFNCSVPIAFLQKPYGTISLIKKIEMVLMISKNEKIK